MENILDRIVTQKKIEVQEQKKTAPLSQLISMPFFHRTVYSLSGGIKDDRKTGIIAEYKRASPSKGIINSKADVAEVVQAYQAGGASAVSVLTDEPFFGGSLQHLVAARSVLTIPLLRKEFIIDEYQLYEAKAFGADAILLIAACLSPSAVQDLAACARSLGLEVLLELHEEGELNHICGDVSVVGINNRNLKTFTVDLDQSMRLAAQLSGVKVAESGINDTATIVQLKDAGFDGFLIGERFMREEDPGAAFKDFVQHLNQPA